FGWRVFSFSMHAPARRSSAGTKAGPLDRTNLRRAAVKIVRRSFSAGGRGRLRLASQPSPRGGEDCPPQASAQAEFHPTRESAEPARLIAAGLPVPQAPVAEVRRFFRVG